jgi:hypothetical protein
MFDQLGNDAVIAKEGGNGERTVAVPVDGIRVDI